MNEHYLEELVQTVTGVTVSGQNIPLEYTGIRKTGGFTAAFEFKSSADGQHYFLKITEAEDNAGVESRSLTKTAQIFRNEIMTEPDPVKRLGYVPVPAILTTDPDKFNREFSALFDRSAYSLQIQTAAEGTHCERELPESLADRIKILLDLAKLLRLCAKNKTAYVDIKPLEHLFWGKDERGLRITLIDWGIARTNASVSLLADDIRKYCLALPEIIYGRKMADLQNKGKLSFPIQKETRKALLPLIDQYSYNGELPPLSAEYALIVGELLGTSVNDFRVQSRCVSLWDAIIDALEQTRRRLLDADDNDTEPIEQLNRQAENAIAASASQLTKDFNAAIRIRQISPASHPAWIIAAVLFLRTWYEKIDLIPHSEFDQVIRLAAEYDYPAALSVYDTLSTTISQKLDASQTCPELRQHLRSFLVTIREVLESASYIYRLRNSKITAAEFLAELSTSPLRVSDPILGDIYYGLKAGGGKANAVISGTAPAVSDAAPASEAPAVSVSNDPLATTSIKTLRTLKLEVDRTDQFAQLVNTGFFQRLNDVCLNRNAFDNPAVQEQLHPILMDIFYKTGEWTNTIRSDKYLVSDEAINSIDWIRYISPIVFTCSVELDGQSQSLGDIIKSELSTSFKDLYFALAKEQTSGEPPELLAKINQIKTLRKRLNTENLNSLRTLIGRGEFESANQIINQHYSEAPFTFDQINNEISRKRVELADQKTLSIITAVLNDLSSGDQNPETLRCLNSQNSARAVNERFYAYRTRTAQLFDLQDDIARIKNDIPEVKKAQHTHRILTVAGIVVTFIGILLSIFLLVTTISKNMDTRADISQMESSILSAQATSEAELAQLRSAYVELLTRPTDVPTPIPTETPMPTNEPEEAPEDEALIRPTEEPTEEPIQVSPEDVKLDGLLNKAVTYDLTGNMILYGSENIDAGNQIGTVYNYAQGLTGKLLGYTDTAVNIETEFNIGRSQISTNNNIAVQPSTYVRLYSSVASETTPIIILQKATNLTQQAADCTTGQQSFCHGKLSLWLDRKAVEGSLK